MENYLVGIVKDLLLCSELNSDEMEPETVNSIARARQALENTEHATKEQIEKARDLYQTDDIEIDGDALTSFNDDGAWISAWVWVNDEELGHKPDASECDCYRCTGKTPREEIEPACGVDGCDSTDDVLSTYCGSLCAEHLAEHCEDCEVCAKDFIEPVTDEERNNGPKRG